MTCSWCDKPISFFRSLKDSRYCCEEHRATEREHMAQLALEMLGAWRTPARQQAVAPDFSESELELKTA